MSETIKISYVIHDPINKTFWVRSNHYGYGAGNKPVFEAKFTEDLTEATTMTKLEAAKVMERFKQFDFVLVGPVKADGQSLLIEKVQVKYSVELW